MPNPSGSTSEYGFPYPLETDVPDVATAIQVLAQAVENLIKLRIGTIGTSASSTLPTRALWCRGQTVSRTTYSALFAAIGTAFGAGDGSSTFNLPNLQGRVPVGAGQGSELTTRPLGSTGGTETVTLTVAELAEHTHAAAPHNHRYPSGANTLSSTTPWSTHHLGAFNSFQAEGPYNSAAAPVTTASASVDETGTNSAHNNMQPFVAVNFYIWYA